MRARRDRRPSKDRARRTSGPWFVNHNPGGGLNSCSGIRLPAVRGDARRQTGVRRILERYERCASATGEGEGETRLLAFGCTHLGTSRDLSLSPCRRT